MKQVYANIEATTGPHRGGICLVEIAAKEWMPSAMLTNFINGKAIQISELSDNKTWLRLQFLEESFEFSENTKSSRAGNFYEQIINGTINDCDDELYQALETLRNHEFIAKITDKQQRVKVCGNVDGGM